MFLFSEVQHWKNCDSVKQIRVFASELAKSAFDNDYAYATSNGENVAAIEAYSDTGKGVAYKVRAVLAAYEGWTPLIRCGYTGKIIWESNLTQDTWQEAMAVALCELQNKVVQSNFPIINNE